MIRRLFSTLAPKPTSKKTKSRHFLLPGMPNVKLTPRQSRNPTHNHILEASDLSRRERHYRRCVAMACCATFPYNPDLSRFVPPYWLTAATSPHNSSNSSTTISSLSSSLPVLGYDPVIQSVGNTRLIKSIVALSDPQFKKSMMHAKVLSEDDLSQAQAILDRSVKPGTSSSTSASANSAIGSSNGANDLLKKLPLIDRVLEEAERKIMEGGVEGGYMHGLTMEDTEAILGSTDLSSTDMNDNQISIDEMKKRELVGKIVSLRNGTAAERMKFVTQEVVRAFRRHDSDCGSIEVQCAILTLRIRNILNHLYKYKQDTRSRVNVDIIINQRRKKLNCLRETDFPKFMRLVRDLGLKMA